MLDGWSSVGQLYGTKFCVRVPTPVRKWQGLTSPVLWEDEVKVVQVRVQVRAWRASTLLHGYTP